MLDINRARYPYERKELSKAVVFLAGKRSISTRYRGRGQQLETELGAAGAAYVWPAMEGPTALRDKAGPHETVHLRTPIPKTCARRRSSIGRGDRRDAQGFFEHWATGFRPNPYGNSCRECLTVHVVLASSASVSRRIALVRLRCGPPPAPAPSRKARAPRSVRSRVAAASDRVPCERFRPRSPAVPPGRAARVAPAPRLDPSRSSRGLPYRLRSR